MKSRIFVALIVLLLIACERSSGPTQALQPTLQQVTDERPNGFAAFEQLRQQGGLKKFSIPFDIVAVSGLTFVNDIPEVRTTLSVAISNFLDQSGGTLFFDPFSGQIRLLNIIGEDCGGNAVTVALKRSDSYFPPNWQEVAVLQGLHTGFLRFAGGHLPATGPRPFAVTFIR